MILRLCLITLTIKNIDILLNHIDNNTDPTLMNRINVKLKWSIRIKKHHLLIKAIALKLKMKKNIVH